MASEKSDLVLHALRFKQLACARLPLACFTMSLAVARLASLAYLAMRHVSRGSCGGGGAAGGINASSSAVAPGVPRLTNSSSSSGRCCRRPAPNSIRVVLSGVAWGLLVTVRYRTSSQMQARLPAGIPSMPRMQRRLPCLAPLTLPTAGAGGVVVGWWGGGSPRLLALVHAADTCAAQREGLAGCAVLVAACGRLQ